MSDVDSVTPGAPAPAWRVWAGRILTALPALVFTMSAAMKLSQSPEVVDGMTKGGFPPGAPLAIGVVELVCLVLYLIPRTAVLGAVLLTGYLGGAVVTHVQARNSFLVPLVVGAMVWAGIYLRETRLWSVLPLRK
ncbi:MAG: DoxX family protein [Myxococcales bacterium]|nr:MAG: DoxX family protein [Myxococcales bacterium]